ncbi:globin [Methylacidiphilum kamchatkense Kam1]|uniref:Globin n=1 Tax=Methylacidiphilum kamchatkense Kam1 TaxID=1202785 RepID=A0A0C1RIW0_9BACT|nr:globin [Methylacidiphilum kamchatkense]KIE58002.1 globin [Methylacidiphilum kamchatkense Kam1]QDQ42440.1 hemoglobin [Methylacidiphilum kamchatkense Kam1]
MSIPRSESQTKSFDEDPPKACCCKKRAGTTIDKIHVCPERVDFIFPEVIFPSERVFKIAGEELLRKLVLRHHENLLKSQIFYLFPTDKAGMEKLVKRSADFVVEMCGGPSYYTASRGEPRMRSRHFSVTIDEKAREVWLACYKYALKEVNFPFSVLEEFWQWIESFSIRIINRRTTLEPPRRIPFAEIKNFFIS